MLATPMKKVYINKLAIYCGLISYGDFEQQLKMNWLS